MTGQSVVSKFEMLKYDGFQSPYKWRIKIILVMFRRIYTDWKKDQYFLCVEIVEGKGLTCPVQARQKIRLPSR
jgi:hypothetical protein